MKSVKTKLIAVVCMFAVLGVASLLFYPAPKVRAQAGQGSGIATLPGQIFANNLVPPPTATGQAGAVTNPASNFVINVQGGPVYFNGSQQFMGQSSLTLLASTTYLVVWNGNTETMYAKIGVTAPGSPSASSGTFVNAPGVPTNLLFAYPGVEIPLATVVCNATACGNGGNGSITDNRPVANFPSAAQIPSSTFANLPATYPDGGLLVCTSCTVLTAGSATCTSGAGVVLAARVSGAWRCF